MDFYTINKLKRDVNQNNLYDFFTVTYDESLRLDTPFQSVRVVEGQYIRMDLISKLVYNDDSYVDFLCDFNYVDNPLNVMSSDELNYPSVDIMSYYRTTEVDRKTTSGVLLDSEKSTKVDENRKKYVEQNYTLTPTSIEVPKEPVQIKQNTIILGS